MGEVLYNEISEELKLILSKEINKSVTTSERISIINGIKKYLHETHSPFKNEPVDCVLWIPGDQIKANDYNPNKVAPPEMKLLEHSIYQDGYTQPIVAWERKKDFEVVDGFHRNRVGKEYKLVKDRLHGFLPISVINNQSSDKTDRIASTIRHNRARGKHQIDAMSDIVLELKSRNWTNPRIAKELGMDEDEILRLCQISGLASLFSDEEFSQSWDVECFDDEFTPLDGVLEESLFENDDFRATNTDDPDRIFHTCDKWECQAAGMYLNSKEGLSKEAGEEEYKKFLSDIERFSKALNGVITEWKHSCEHYLTNKAMNRIAWMGQAAMCYDSGIPATYRGGFHLLSQQEQQVANETALEYLNKWMISNNRGPLTMEQAVSGDRQVGIY